MGRVMDRIKARRNARAELMNPAYEIFIGILSLLSIVNLVLIYVLRDDEPLQAVLAVVNVLLSGLFLIDFLVRLFRAPSAARYFFRDFGWADLLASVPFPQLNILRVFRLLRVARLMRTLGLRQIWQILVRDRANSMLMTLLLLGVLVLQFGSLSVLAVESGAEEANITTAADALWYTIVTISTVGYGDEYPVTTFGRLLGTLIIIIGVGIFGTFTGYIANFFLAPSSRDDPDTDVAEDDVHAGVDAATVGVAAGAMSGAIAVGSAGADDPATVDRLQALLAQSEQLTAELRELLAAQQPGPGDDG